MAKLSDLSNPSMQLKGIQNPMRKVGTHPAYQIYVEQMLKAGKKPMSAEEFTKSQR